MRAIRLGKKQQNYIASLMHYNIEIYKHVSTRYDPRSKKKTFKDVRQRKYGPIS